MRLALGILLLGAGTAEAQHPPITVDDVYAIELYEGVALGDSVQTGMGGAGAARIIGSAGVLLNPSAPAIRKTTDNSKWGWDYHLDFLTGRFSSDYDNNGQATNETSGAGLVTFGLAIRYGIFAGAATFTIQSAPIDGSMPKLTAETTRAKIVLATYAESYDISVGFGIQSVQFKLAPEVGDDLFAMTGTGGVLGLTWLPRNTSYRVALALESRILGNEVTAENCEPNPEPKNCNGYFLPEKVESPGRTIIGFAYRFAPTAWNQQVKPKFRDERALTITTDVVVAGNSTNGHGLEAFGMMQLQPAGQHITFSPRLGGEIEAIPGRLRFRAGSYWEPGRFEGVGGRIHGTFGFEVRWLEFKLFGLRRFRFGATTDIASRYRNIGISAGFWQ